MDSQHAGSRSWPVIKDGRPHTLTVREDGLTVSEDETGEETVTRWGEVQAITFPTALDVRFSAAGDEVALGFHAGAIQRELRSVLQAREVAFDVTAPAAPASTPSAPRHPAAGAKEDSLWIFLIAALALGFLGFLLVLTQLAVAIAIGFALIGVANLLALVSIIGWGVKFGIRAAVADGTLQRR